MAQTQAILRQILITEYLKRPMNFEDLKDKILENHAFQDIDFDYSDRTFLRDRETIREVFGIEIKFDFSEKKYKISDAESVDFTRVENLKQQLDTMNILNLSNRFAKYIQFDKRISIVEQFVREILNAIDQNNKLKFNYKKYNETKATERLVEPYLIKEFRKRWFLVAKDLNDKNLTVKSFALDRINFPKKQNDKFSNTANSEINEKFNDFYGVNTYSEGQVENIMLSFTNEKADYIEKIPLHSTQQKVLTSDKETTFSLRLNPTDEFVSELLSYGKDVKVLQPKSLADEVAKMHRLAYENYK